MAICRLATATRNALANALRDLIDAGGGPGLVRFYTGPMPATPDTAITTQTLLGTLTFSDPSAPGAAGGTSTYSPITEDSLADNTGTAAWARIVDSTGAVVHDVDVGGPGSGAFIELNTTSIVAGGPIEITAWQLTVPMG